MVDKLRSCFISDDRRPNRHAAQIVCRAVNRVNDPLAVHATAYAKLLTDNAIIGAVLGQDCLERLLNRLIREKPANIGTALRDWVATTPAAKN